MTYNLGILQTINNIRPVQAFQSISVRLITGVSWFITNEFLPKDLKLPTVNELVNIHYQRFHAKLINLLNLLISNMFSLFLPDEITRRLKRYWYRDLL